MRTLISPEYNFELFCYRVLATDPPDPIVVLDAVTDEAWLARKLHQDKCNGAEFRRGSRGRAYCDDLRRLVGVLMNGDWPDKTPPEFIRAMAPLARHLLKRHDIGKLRQNLG